MPKHTIINNPVKLQVHISKATGHGWTVTPSLTAFSLLTQPPKNIVFLLDTSGSMQERGRLQKVKNAASNLLDKLNAMDTFSIVSFDSSARSLVIHKKAISIEISAAKALIHSMQASGGTNFSAAFAAINDRAITPLTSHSTIIFLTDGECNVTAKSLLTPFPKMGCLRVMPIGVGLGPSGSPLLNQLAIDSKGGTSAIYIHNDDPSSYQDAFDTAFKIAMQQSDAPAQLEMSIRAHDKTQFAKLDLKRQVSHIYYDSASSTSASFHFDSPTPPRYFKLRFDCDHMSLQAEHRLSADCYAKLEQQQPIAIRIPAFQWKNNSTFSWMMAFGALVTGSLILATVAVLALSSPALSLWMWKPLVMSILAGLAGLALFIAGITAICRKTIFLPTKNAVVDEEPREHSGLLLHNRTQEGWMGLNPLGQLSRVAQNPLARKILRGTVLAGGGAAVGYLGGTVAVATNAVLATGISPYLFMVGCTMSGAIALPLMVYGCLQLHSACARLQPSRFFPQAPSGRKILTGAVLVGGGAAGGYLGGTVAAAANAVIATGISPYWLITGCTISGAIAVPLMAYGCLQLHSACTSIQPAR